MGLEKLETIFNVSAECSSISSILNMPLYCSFLHSPQIHTMNYKVTLTPTTKKYKQFQEGYNSIARRLQEYLTENFAEVVTGLGPRFNWNRHQLNHNLQIIKDPIPSGLNSAYFIVLIIYYQLHHKVTTWRLSFHSDL